MEDLLNAITAGLAAGFKALAGASPVLVAVGMSLGLIERISIEYFAKVTNSTIFSILLNHSWFEYSIISIGLLCIPVLFGKTSVPKDASEKITTIKNIIKEAKFTRDHERSIWNEFLKVMLQNVANRDLGVDEVFIKHSEKRSKRGGL